MNVLIIDNYDSFTYNIAHIIRNFPGVNLQIKTADLINIEDIESFNKIIFSPGPDLPAKGNIMSRILRHSGGDKSILGICLGLQAIVLHYGGRLVRLDEVVHGRTKLVSKTSIRSHLFDDLPASFECGLYHSWIADPEYLPSCLDVTTVSPEKRIMGIKHKSYDIEALQFHPESIMTRFGKQILHNWIGKI
jgi:anthranilate synthase component 2